MKLKHLILFAIGLLHMALSYAEEYEYECVFNVEDYKLNLIQSCVRVESSNLNDFTGRDGLPTRSMQLILSAGSRISNSEIIPLETMVLATDVDLRGTHAYQPIGSILSDCVYKEANMVSPIYLVNKGGISSIDYVDYADCTVAYWGYSPIEYNPITGELSFTKKVRFQMSETPYELSDTIEPLNDITKDLLSQTAINPEDLPIKEEEIELLGLDDNYELQSGSIVDYVVITSAELAPAFSNLIKWKTLKGLSCEVVTIDSIKAQYGTGPLHLLIKRCIRDLNTTKGVSYFLLGGDHSVVPAPKASAKVRVGRYSDGSDRYCASSNIPTDLYYACFEKCFEWDANDDGILGEMQDGCSLIPNVLVTRFPFSEKPQIEALSAKIIAYEKNPAMAWKLMMTGAYEIDERYEDGCDGLTVAEQVYTSSVLPYWDGYYVDLFDDLDRVRVTPNNVVGLFDQVNAFVGVYAHGSPTGWHMGEGNDFTTDYVKHINAHTRTGTFISTIACHTNAFDKSDVSCLSKELLASPTSGIIGYWGSSRESWAEDTIANGGPAIEYEKQYYKSLFDAPSESKNFGRITALTKLNLMVAANDWDAYRWLMYSMNPMGDPETPVYVKRPQLFNGVTITKYTSYVEIDAGESGATIAVTGERNGVSTLAVLRGIRKGRVRSLPNDPTICITKQNFLPKILTSTQIDNMIITPYSSGGAILECYAENGGECLTVVTEMSGDRLQKANLTVVEVMKNCGVSVPVDASQTTTIGLQSLPGGIYVVALNVDGECVDTRKHVVHK